MRFRIVLDGIIFATTRSDPKLLHMTSRPPNGASQPLRANTYYTRSRITPKLTLSFSVKLNILKIHLQMQVILEMFI